MLLMKHESVISRSVLYTYKRVKLLFNFLKHLGEFIIVGNLSAIQERNQEKIGSIVSKLKYRIADTDMRNFSVYKLNA